MKRRWHIIGLAVCMVMLCCACGKSSNKPSNQAGSGADQNTTSESENVADLPYVGIVLKSTDNPYFALIKAGAEDEADILGVQVMVVSPDTESNTQEQADLVSTMANMAVDVIAVAPSDEESLTDALEQAVDRGKIIMSVDTSLDFADCSCYIGSDQYAGGYQQGKYAAELVAQNDNAYAVILRGAETDKTHTLREYGITDALEDGNVYVLGAEDCGSDEEQAEKAMADLLEEHPELNVVCTTSDSMAVGAQRAIANAKRKDIHIVSFDGLQEALELVRIGELDATFAQDPYEMGRKCIEYAMRLYNGEKLDESYHTEVKRITSGNAEAQVDKINRQLNHKGGK
ncbi:MAG: sugar ABC transporter substrate-binding protein [Eubacteriales bacterium]|nr:sugar ABC transporter substrate-binding protein [Eubacteriales bacterium]